MPSLPFVIEQLLTAPVAVVWKAITDKTEMKQWYFGLAEFKPVVGFQFQFYGEGRKGEKYLHICKITEVIAEKNLFTAGGTRDMKAIHLYILNYLLKEIKPG